MRYATISLALVLAFALSAPAADYAAACAEALKSNKPLAVSVGCSAATVPGCVNCSVTALEGFTTGVHLAVPDGGKLWHAGQLSGSSPTVYSQGNPYGVSSGGCAGGSCGASSTTSARGFGLFRRR